MLTSWLVCDCMQYSAAVSPLLAYLVLF
jgi:hypothetical protein